MNPKVFIINLEKSIERKEFMIQQFESLEKKVNYQFFPAIYGKENPNHPLFTKYNRQKRIERKGNEMNLSQLGCFASHYLLWEKCVELNTGIIILEDDAIIHPNFTEAYNFISSPQNIFEFFWLSPPAPIRRGQKGKTILNINNSNNVIAQFYKGWGNATGYFISPHGAKKLLDYCQEWVYDADISMDRYWENKLQYLAFTPACVEPDFSKESNIPVDKGKTKRTMGVKIKRELYKLVDNINKSIYDLSHK